MLSAGAPFYRVVEGLLTGYDYYVRVRAHNSQGFGLPQASSPTYAHPMVIQPKRSWIVDDGSYIIKTQNR